MAANMIGLVGEWFGWVGLKRDRNRGRVCSILYYSTPWQGHNHLELIRLRCYSTLRIFNPESNKADSNRPRSYPTGFLG